MTNTVPTDDGRELPLTSADGKLLPISPEDIVGPYEARSTITFHEMRVMRSRRMEMGAATMLADLEALTVPTENLTVGWCIDVFGAGTEGYAQAVADYYDEIRHGEAAELAVRRELRAKGIGVKRN